MSEIPSYESSLEDLKLKRFVSHCQTTHVQANDHEHCNTDYRSASPDQTETTQRSNMNALKGLKVDQTGIIWGPNGTLRGRVVEDSPAHPQKVEGYPLDGKVEVHDEDGQKTRHALAHETSAATNFMSMREHPFYKLRPDGNGQYHCPYTSSEGCWYRPEKFKYKFHEHLDTHMKPYSCEFVSCDGCLPRHESEAHNMHGHRARPYSVLSHSGVDLPEKANTPSVLKSPYNDCAATTPHRTHDSFERPHVRLVERYENCVPMEDGDENDGDELKVPVHLNGGHVLAPPATPHGRIPSSVLNEPNGKKGVGFFDSPLEPKYTATPRPRQHPKPTSIPATIDSEQAEHKKKVEVDVDFLHKLESKISILEYRVQEFEGRPGSPTNSSISDSQESMDSVSNFDYRSTQGAKDFSHSDDDIIIFEPEVENARRDAMTIAGPSLRVARWKSFGTSGRHQRVLYEGEGMPSRARDLRNVPLLALTEEYCSNGKFWRKRLAIASPAFHELLKEVSCHNLGDIALHDNVFNLTEPFMVLFLNRKQLSDYVQKTSEFTYAKEHAKFILDFMKTDLGDISRMVDNFESVTPPNLVKFSDLWMLYRPGTTVYSRADGEWEAFVVDSLDGMQVRKPSSDSSHALTRLDVTTWSVNFDGEVYGRVWSIHCVAPFRGVREISSLPLVPERFLSDGKAIRESLLSRGREFCGLQVQHCQVSEVSSQDSFRVMVDHLTYQRHNGWLISIDGKHGPSSAKNKSWIDDRDSGWCIQRVRARRPSRYTPQRSVVRHFEDEYCPRDYALESIDGPEITQAEPCRSYSADRPAHVVVSEFEKYNLIQPGAEMDELSLILCPQQVHVFCFRDKVWKLLNVSDLQPVYYQDHVWDCLVLDEEYKDILETMISSHVDRVSGLGDSATGKGLSVLLHGEPGNGKTLTAESIAEHFGKPLLPVTCSDVGVSVSRFDERLEQISDYGTRWGAILLFDEADILLQARRDYESSNFKRNELLSSFVQFINYYEGIVIITTNRVTRFDGSLMPRIDITLGLPPLDSSRRVSIWHNQIEDLFVEGYIHASEIASLRSLAQEKWSQENLNGHQIKKVIKTARIMAEKKGKMLGRGEIETMLKIEREFQDRIGDSDHMKEKGGKKKKAGGKKGTWDLDDFEEVEKP